MKVEQRTESDVTIIQPSGRIDAAGLQEFSAAINRAIQDGSPKVLLDFSKTEYMSSAGIRVLIDAKKAIEAKNGTIALCSVNEHLKELFEVVRIDKIFTIYDSDFAALDKMMA